MNGLPNTELQRELKRGGSGRLRRWLDSPPPSLAIAIGPQHVAGLRRQAGGPQPQGSAVSTLPAGAVKPAAQHVNLAQPAIVQAALREVLDALAGQGNEIILLVPEMTARLTVLEFEQLPDSEPELRQLVLFRLRKALPFEPEETAMSLMVERARKTAASARVLAAIADRRRLDEYEEAVAEAGARAVTVMPAALAALAALPELRGGALLVKADACQLTAAFAWEGYPRFCRVVESNTDGQPDDADLYTTLAYYRDFLEQQQGMKPNEPPQVITAGLDAARLARLRLEQNWAELRDARDLAPPPHHWPAGSEGEWLALLGAMENSFL